MSPSFVHRVSGARTTRPPARTVPGVWEAAADAQAAFLNTVPMRVGDLLVPDSLHRWTLVSESGERLEGHFDPALEPDPYDAENVAALGARLREEASLAGWLHVPPLVPSLPAQVHMQPLETAVAGRLEHLQVVCHEPKSHLHSELELVRVSRARRVPLRALARLASHPEDWERRTLSGVRPQRVLSVVADERLDIYENRVTARLVDRLLEHLRRRIGQLTQIMRMMDAVMDQEGAASGTIWRRNRLFELLGWTMVDASHRETARRTRHALLSLHDQLLVLRDSPLYRGVSLHARVAPELKPTNILTKDPHYRQVAALWRDSVQSTPSLERTPRQRFEQEQQQVRDFDRVALLVVLHALQACGFTLAEPGADEVSEWSATGPWGMVRLHVDDWRCVTLIGSGGEARVRLVPVFACLARAPEARLEHLLAELEARTPEASARRRRVRDAPGRAVEFTDTIVLYLGSAEDRARLSPRMRTRIYDFGADRGGARVGRPGFLPLSLSEIESVERVARALRWCLMGPILSALPVRTTVPNQVRANLPRDGLLRFIPGSNVAELVRVPGPAEWEALERTIEAELRAASGRGKAARGQVDEVERFRSVLEEGVSCLQQLSRCPLCEASGERENSFPAQGDLTFAWRCAECDTQWGTRRCNSCQKSYPYLLPKLPDRDRPTTYGPEWLDRTYGADLLAVPCWERPGGGTYICPRCGYCHSAEPLRSRCRRCQS